MNKKRGREVTLEGQISFQRRLPIELKRRFLKTSRGPKHFHRPPSERPDITQIKKIRQRSLQKKSFSVPRAENGHERECQNRLRAAQSNGQLLDRHSGKRS